MRSSNAIPINAKEILDENNNICYEFNITSKSNLVEHTIPPSVKTFLFTLNYYFCTMTEKRKKWQFVPLKKPEKINSFHVEPLLNSIIHHPKRFVCVTDNQNNISQIKIDCEQIIFDFSTYLKERNITAKDVPYSSIVDISFIFKNTCYLNNPDRTFQIIIEKDNKQYIANELSEYLTAFTIINIFIDIIKEIYKKQHSYKYRVLCHLFGFIYQAQNNFNFNNIWQKNIINHLYVIHHQAPFYDLHLNKEKLLALLCNKSLQIKILMHLEKHDTKQARNALLYNIPFKPAFAKMLINSTTLETEHEMKLLYEYCKIYGFDRIMLLHKLSLQEFNITLQDRESLILSNKDYYLKETAVTTTLKLIQLLDLGFNFTHIYRQFDIALKNNTSADFIGTIQHSLSMHQELCIYYGTLAISSPNLKQWHTDLINRLRQYHTENTRLQIEKYNIDFQSKYFKNQYLDDYQFTNLEKISDLISIGETMRNCLGSFGYMREILDKQVEIIVIKKQDKMLACIEIKINADKTKQLGQAKLKYNEPVSKNKEIASVIKKWAKENKVKTDFSSDLNNY